MTLILIGECLLLVGLFACSAFFSSAETAMFSLNPFQIHRVRKIKPRVADAIERLLAKPTRLLSSILIGNTVVNVVASVLGFTIAEHLMPGYGEAVSIPVLTLALLVFGEVAPKRLAIARPEQLAALYAGPLRRVVGVFSPARVLMEGLAALLARHFTPTRKELTEDEFLTVVEVGEEEGVLDKEERTMVDGIIRLEETQASDVMTPRVDLVGIDLDDPIEDNERIARSIRYRYLPVYRETLDHIEGFLDVPRFLLAPSPNLGAAMIRPLFVPETARLDTLLTTFQRENRRVAVVVDEYGGTAGLITRGDILEEIAADVDNEYGEESITIRLVGKNRWLVDGSASLEDINYETGLELDAEGADRIAGWVSAIAERVPRAGDIVEGQGCRATVQRVRRHRVLAILLEKLPHEHAPGEAPGT